MIDILPIPLRMYDAAFHPESWDSIIQDVAMLTNSSFGALSFYWPRQESIAVLRDVNSSEPVWQQSPDLAQRWISYIRSKNYLNNGFFQFDLLTEDWSDIPDYDVVLTDHIKKKNGVRMINLVELFNGEFIALEFSRKLHEPRYDQSDVSLLNDLNDAFKQSVLFASRLHLERAKGSLETLNDLRLAAALLGENGEILYENEHFNQIEEYITRLPSGQVTIRGDETLRCAFAMALEQAKSVGGSFALPPDSLRPGAIVELIPTVGNTRETFRMKSIIMVITPIAPNLGVPTINVVGKLFGLTPAESRLAVTLSSGLSLRDSATSQGITVGTARAYLIRIFAKTGTNQQGELVSLLKSIRSPL